MKKITLFATSILVAALLIGCSKKTTQPSTSSSSSRSSQTSQSSTASSTSPSSHTTESASTEDTNQSPAFATMDIEAISKGDFSSVIGRWEGADGRSLTFNALGLTDGEQEIQGQPKVVDGALQVSVVLTGGRGGFGLLMIPSGVSFPRDYYEEGEDTTDIKRDRMFGSQTQVQRTDDSLMYYRVAPTSAQGGNPLTNNHTGVSLESGQVTIDFATTILGNLNWKVIESNYNRTEGIPFELLQGDNGSLYRVYRNGVILSQEKNVIVYMP